MILNIGAWLQLRISYQKLSHPGDRPTIYRRFTAKVPERYSASATVRYTNLTARLLAISLCMSTACGLLSSIFR